MRIAVTGHLGTLGAPLTAKLRERGHDVMGIDLRHSHDGVRADVGEYRQIRDVLHAEDFDMVFHLAAEFGRHNGEEYTEQLWRSNVIGTKNILRVQRERGFRLVFASSSEVYGETPQVELREDMIARHPSELTNDYATSKWVNEGQIANDVKRYGTESMILRFFNAYGPGEHYHRYRSVVCLFCYHALHGLPYDVYQNYHRVFQYVDDLVATLASVPHRFHPGETINIGGDEYRSVEALHLLISRELGIDPDRHEVRRLPEDAHNVVNKRPNIDKARRLLGHHPVIRLEDGIKATIGWMRETYPPALVRRPAA